MNEVNVRGEFNRVAWGAQGNFATQRVGEKRELWIKYGSYLPTSSSFTSDGALGWVVHGGQKQREIHVMILASVMLHILPWGWTDLTLPGSSLQHHSYVAYAGAPNATLAISVPRPSSLIPFWSYTAIPQSIC